ncbi:hypothetical protein [uncultured Alistipes sp.]|uniref:hypothetical protein n=1 Tax=uncultured Alistipes sp. TaxID=538949 RepID=UPI00260942A0|nr:hypothetical protein [uncultured Alistipes sp.]
MKNLLLLLLGLIISGCSNEQPIIPPPAADSDPTERFIYMEGSRTKEEIIEALETRDGTAYFTSFCFCNDSDHWILPVIEIKETSYVILSGIMPKGYKYMTFYRTDIPMQKKLYTFDDIASIEIFYDVGKEFIDQYPTIPPEMKIYEQYTDLDLTGHYDTKDIRDENQWSYIEFSPNHAQWSYIIDNEDFERARRLAQERETDN